MGSNFLRKFYGRAGLSPGRRGDMINALAEDLDQIIARTAGLWEEIRGERIFVTGGTGFFGCWLLESFAWANRKLDLNASAMVLTRKLDRLRERAPHLIADPAIQLLQGDVRDFDFPNGNFLYIIHAATAASAKINEEDPLLMLDTIVLGTRRVLDFAIRCGAKKFLLTSSGAVYGKQPPDLSHMPEDYRGAPDTLLPHCAYAEGKRVSELLCTIYANKYGLPAKIARCWTFVGPYLPLDLHYAVGNFIRDGLRGGPIAVKGDGTPFRSYLYAADLATWLWTILFLGASCRAYNVGSAKEIAIADLASVVAQVFGPGIKVHISQESGAEKAPDRYVPSVARAENELRLRQTVNLRQAVEKTAAWHIRESDGCFLKRRSH